MATPRLSCTWPVVISVVIAFFWLFPRFWYTAGGTTGETLWLVENTSPTGWRFESSPVGKSAEAILAADSLFYGEFTSDDGAKVRLFTARRYRENPHEIGLFVHTPDRCWTEAGWRIQPTTPDHLQLKVAGAAVGVERRVFVHPGYGVELVYFFGLVGGEALPYRLDHNLRVGQRLRPDGDAGGTSGTGLRATDSVFWTRVLDSFRSRRRLLGPKEFLRISTTVVAGDFERADALLQLALSQLLVPMTQSAAIAASSSRP